MSQVLTSKQKAKEFVELFLRQEAESIVVTMNQNGSYLGRRVIDDNGPQADPASISAALAAATTAIDADVAEISITKGADGRYTVVTA
jgi:hypothetical protein